MKDFSGFNLPRPLMQALAKMKFTTPTPIQAAAIPPALAGRDILGSAQTGTGKTAAFAIPMLAHLLANKDSMALVMTPTRELATQVIDAATQMMGEGSGLRSALLIGGQSMFKQLQQLKARPRLIIGTPGRINDHLQQRSLNLSRADFLVLDETDKMLDMGFDVQIEKVIRNLPQKRQTLLFSATLPPFIVKLADKYLHKPERVAVGASHLPAPKIKHELLQVTAGDKYNMLLAQLRERSGSVIIFVKTKRGADKLAKKLNGEKLGAEAIHGDLNQNKRDRVIAAFRAMKHRILVATDVAARGLDIPHIEHVINYDLPQVAEDYIHRIGRTARAGAEGAAVCFITPEDREKWREIHKLMNPGEKPPADTRRAPAAGTPRPQHMKKSRGYPHPARRKKTAGGRDRSRDDGDSRPARDSRDGRGARGGLQGAGASDTRGSSGGYGGRSSGRSSGRSDRSDAPRGRQAGSRGKQRRR